MGYDTNVEIILLLLRRCQRNLNGVLLRTEEPVEMTAKVLADYKRLVDDLSEKLEQVSSQVRETTYAKPVRKYKSNAYRKEVNRLKRYGFIPKE